jgi:hypothetical protein
MIRRPLLVVFLVTLVFVLVASSYQALLSPLTEAVFAPKSSRKEAAPLCPWREPEADLRRFFPGATQYRAETSILSGMRVDLARRLGRPVLPEENALRIYRVLSEGVVVGMVLLRRVKGEHGAIEIVTAVDPQGQVRGVRMQRLREPPLVSETLESAAWLRSLQGQTASSRWQLGSGIDDVPPPARKSAQAILDAVRSLMVLLEAANRSGLAAAHAGH